MVHQPLPLPPPDDEFDDSEEETREGLERRVDFLAARLHDAERGWQEQLGALAGEVREATATAKQSVESTNTLTDEIRKLTKLILEERAERFALGDRVSNLEQPRSARRKR